MLDDRLSQPCLPAQATPLSLTNDEYRSKQVVVPWKHQRMDACLRRSNQEPPIEPIIAKILFAAIREAQVIKMMTTRKAMTCLEVYQREEFQSKEVALRSARKHVYSGIRRRLRDPIIE